MGVYIPPPPPGKGSGSGGKDDDKNNNSSSSNQITPSSSSTSGSPPDSTSDDDYLSISIPSRILPINPSFGLQLWGPFVPAADNKAALALCTGTQILTGLFLFGNFRRLKRYPHLTRGERFSKWTSLPLSLITIMLSGLEMFRLSVPNDPWYNEAHRMRKEAIKNGLKPSWWFGAIDIYHPMSVDKWHNEVLQEKGRSILDREIIKQQLQQQQQQQQQQPLTPIIPQILDKDVYGSIVSGLKPESDAQSQRFEKMHEVMRERNAGLYRDLLSNALKDVNELNKAQRLDDIMEGKGDIHYNDSYAKPPIQLGDHGVESDDEFEMVWLNFEPWEELLATGFAMTLIVRRHSLIDLGDEEANNESQESQA